MNPLAEFLALPLSQFRPWVWEGRCPQGRFLRAAETHRHRLLLGGNRSGKTETGIVDSLLMALHAHPWAEMRPGDTEHWVVAVTMEFVGAVHWPKIQRLLGEDYTRALDKAGKIAWLRVAGRPIPKVVTLPHSRIVFMSAKEKRGAFQGAGIDSALVDEECPAEIVEELKPRLLDNDGYLSVTLTPIMRSRWVRAMMSEDGVYVGRMATLDAARAGMISLERTLAYAKTLPDRIRRVRLEGELLAMEGLVWPEFDSETHVAKPRDGQLYVGDVRIGTWPLPESWPREVGIDFGYSHAMAVVVAAEDPYSGRLIVERVYYAAEVRITTWAKLLLDLLPRTARRPYSDHDRVEREELRAAGLNTHCARKEVEPGIESVACHLHERLEDGVPRLVIVEDERLVHPVLGRCDGHPLIREIEGYQRLPQRDAEDERPDVADRVLKRDDHACDATRYMIHSRRRRRWAEPPPLDRSKPENLDRRPRHDLVVPQSGFGGLLGGQNGRLSP